jgi:hypothetical protein
MMMGIKTYMDYVLAAQDGEIGRCKDFLFDDELWTIRFMVADTGKWLPGRKVVISPVSLGETDMDSRRMHVNLTKDQIKESPPLAAHAPVSRQYEIQYFDHFGWPYYWVGESVWGMGPEPRALYHAHAEPPKSTSETEALDKHLRSVDEVLGYRIRATDGEIGHAGDFLVDDETWVLRYLIVDTGRWLPGRQVCLPLATVRTVEWVHRHMAVDLSKDAVKNSPPYDPLDPITREYEVVLHDYYGWTKYWE